MTWRTGRSAAVAPAANNAQIGKHRSIIFRPHMQNAVIRRFLSNLANYVSFAHYFHYDAFGALAVELRVINLLPGTEIEPARGHRYDHLMMHDEVLQMGITIGFPGAVVPVILTKRRDFLQPLVDI